MLIMVLVMTMVIKVLTIMLMVVMTKELVPFTQLVKVRRGKLVLALPSIRFS